METIAKLISENPVGSFIIIVLLLVGFFDVILKLIYINKPIIKCSCKPGCKSCNHESKEESEEED